MSHIASLPASSIHDPILRWIVTALFTISATECVYGIAARRYSWTGIVLLRQIIGTGRVGQVGDGAPHVALSRGYELSQCGLITAACRKGEVADLVVAATGRGVSRGSAHRDGSDTPTT